MEDHSSKIPLNHLSQIGVVCTFGGQGFEYLQELRTIYENISLSGDHTEDSKTLLQKLLLQANEILSSQSSSAEARSLGLYKEGFNIIDWINDEDVCPSENYLSSSPISYPLIFLTQVCQYASTAFSLFPADKFDPILKMKELWKGTTGHSQGIISSILVSVASNTQQYLSLSMSLLQYSFWLGARFQQVYDNQYLKIGENDTEENPMLSILGLPLDVLDKVLTSVNKTIHPDYHIELSLINGPRNFVCTGRPDVLKLLHSALGPHQSKGEDQSRVPYSKRKYEFKMSYLSTSVPFHNSKIMNLVNSLVSQDLTRLKISNLATFTDLKIPVYSTLDGSNLASKKESSMMEHLTALMASKPVYWEKCLKEINNDNGITHVVDFGCGPSCLLVARVKEGRGIKVIQANSTDQDNYLEDHVLPKSYLSSLATTPAAENWKRFLPKLVKIGDKTLLDTKLSRITGKSPIIVAGMTPTTANEQIVIAFTNAGYQGEFAGGGQARPEIFRNRIKNIVDMIIPDSGNGINVNILYLNQRLWNFQYSMCLEMKKEGIPIDSITVAAGVPTLEKANQMIQEMLGVGMKYISFKPGSIQAIKDVVTIAQHNPTMHVILQWTGGRAGGHHSFEDTHDPIIRTYSLIRSCPNIALVIGGGIGSPEDSMKYLTGVWCHEHFYGTKYLNNYSTNDILMPFDGILLGTRIMAAKETLTSLSVKQLLVNTEGIHLMNERDWEKSYEQPVGGCITIISELNEPIHVIANRSAMLWKEFDTKFFAHHIQVQEKEFSNSKTQEYIISRLNRDYQKIYFGIVTDKNEIVHISDMTYYAIAQRFIELTYISGQFVHSSYRDRLVAFLQRIEERFYLETTKSTDLPKKIDSNLTFDSLIGESTIDQLNSNPMEVVEEITKKYIGSRSQIIITEDVDFFLQICKDTSFGKPVNFIPIIDKDFSVWFKKDSLWYSENIELVKDEDPQRVIILSSPVSVHYIKNLNEPIADLLNHFNSHLIQDVTNTYYGGDSNHSGILKREYIGGSPIESVRSEEISGLSVETTTIIKNTKVTTLRLRDINVDVHKWTEFLAGNKYSWWRAFLTSPHVIHYSKYKVGNYFKSIFKPRMDVDKIELVEENGNLTTVKLFSKTFTQIQKDETLPEVLVTLVDSSNIRVEFSHVKSSESVKLCVDFAYNPQRGHSPISLKSNSTKYNEIIKEFYAKLWIQSEFKELSVNHNFVATKKLNKTQFDDFLKSIRRPAIQNTGNNSTTPVAVDLAVVFAWEALSSTLFVKEIDSSLFQLLHLSYGYKILSTDLDSHVTEGDSITSKIHITEIVNTNTGKRVTALGYLYKNDKSTPILEVTSQFFFKGNYTDHQHSFRIKRTKKVVTIHDKLMKEILESRKWIQFNSVHSKKSQIPTPIQIGDSLIFDIESTYYYSSFEGENYSRIITRGSVDITRGGEDSRTVGNIEIESQNINKDVVESFLERHGKNVDNIGIFDNGGYVIVDNATIPSPTVVDSELYARASGDYNPIHYNSSLALFSGLESTITHGMWTAAMGRNFIETSLQLGSTGDKSPSYKIKSYSVNFMEKVLPEQKLHAKLSHVGMKNGLKLIELIIVNDQEAVVMKASAEVDAGHTAYVFTGQGSAEINMGMDLYESSEVARSIWDRAEAYMLNNYGFSLMKIVKQNPKEITINFQAEKGTKIRAKYTSLKHTHKGKDGTSIMVPLFPDITDSTETYTFDHPQGLLYQTQFQQPALTLVEKAAFDDMKSKGFVHKDSTFAGHSLGEYSALASVANVLSIEDLVELVFIRGITMQNCVKRNQHGLSNFGMVAVNPTRVTSSFNIDNLHKLVDLISEISKRLLQVVNYNVYNWQFVVSGHNSNLETLRIVLNKIKENPKLISKELDSQLVELVTKTLALYPNEDENELDEYNIVTLQQGVASIPLLGIDVPFHSKYLLPEVPQFRNYLLKTLDYKNLNIDLLENKYIPNLTAEPFKISLEYANSVIQVTHGASILSEIIKSRSFDLNNYEDKRLLGYFILVELLAFQFGKFI